MRISGQLVPFPDTGAADLMSDHLEQIVEANGPGKILCKITLPKTLPKPPDGFSEAPGGFARKMVEIAKQEGEDWLPLWSSTSHSYQALEEISCDVVSAGAFKCKIMNMSGTEGQFTLESTFLPNPLP
jgi:hypothetical protein